MVMHLRMRSTAAVAPTSFGENELNYLWDAADFDEQ
jgi:hypothetical protein